MPYKVCSFKLEHLDELDQRDEQKEEIKYFQKHAYLQKHWFQANPMMTLMYEGRPIFILGIQNGGLGTYFPIVFASKNLDKHVRSVVRFIYEYVDDFVSTDVRRFEAYISSLDPEAGRLARFFGFEPIGIRRQAGLQEEDQIIYERLWRK